MSPRPVDRGASVPTGRNYADGHLITYPMGLVDYAAGLPAAGAIKRPPGVRYCKIVEAGGYATEIFNEVTTQAFLRIGTAADADKFLELPFGSLAATDSIGIRDDATAIKDADNLIDMDNDGDAGASLDQLEVAFVQNTGGTPTGIAETFITLLWW